MIKEPKLTYSQLRQILSLVLTNKGLRAKLEDFLSGKMTKFSELELLDMIQASEADKDLIRILSNLEPDEMDALDALNTSLLFSPISEPAKRSAAVGSQV